MDHRFRAELAAGGMCLRMRRVELHLDDAAPIAKVDEDQATQVAAPVYPAVEVCLTPQLVGPELAGGRARSQAHAEPNIWVTADSKSRSATLVCVLARMSRITTSLFSRSSGPTSRATRAPRRAALRSFASRRADPGSKTTRSRRERKVEARWKTYC